MDGEGTVDVGDCRDVLLGTFTVTPGSGSPSASNTKPVIDDLLVAYPAVPAPVCWE